MKSQTGPHRCAREWLSWDLGEELKHLKELLKLNLPADFCFLKQELFDFEQMGMVWVVEERSRLGLTGSSDWLFSWISLLIGTNPLGAPLFRSRFESRLLGSSAPIMVGSSVNRSTFLVYLPKLKLWWWCVVVKVGPSARDCSINECPCAVSYGYLELEIKGNIRLLQYF